MKKQLTFNLLVIYYFILVNSVSFRYGYDYSGFGTLKWFLLIAPVCIFIGINYTSYIRNNYKLPSVLLLVYIVSVLITSSIRADIHTAFNIIIWFLPIIIILNSNIYLNLKLLNILFLLSIFLSIISYYFGTSVYGFLPGQAMWKDFSWRISLGNQAGPAATGFLSLLTLMANYFYNNRKCSKYFFILISIYFLIFSGSRSALICLFLFLFFVIFSHIIEFRDRSFYKLIALLVIILFIVLNYNPGFLLKYSRANEFINSYVFHVKDVNLLTEEEFRTKLARPIIWSQHFKIFLTNPLIGVGHYSLYDYFPYAIASGSESIFTRFLARDGMLIFLLMAFLYQLIKIALKEKDLAQYVFSISFIILLISYGSFCFTHNYIFLMMLAFIKSGHKYKIFAYKNK